MTSPYDTDLGKNAANYQPLTPLVFLERAASDLPRPSRHRRTASGATPMPSSMPRSRRLASALAAAGHRQERHGLGDARQHARHARGALRRADGRRGAAFHQHAARPGHRRLHARPRRRQGAHRRYRDCAGASSRRWPRRRGQARRDRLSRPRNAARTGAYRRLDYEEFIAGGDPDYAWDMPSDEWDAISLNYTTGTTGNPKGVVYHHRGAALMGYANTIATGMGPASGLSVDAADVSLQRLVLSLVAVAWWPAPMSACARCGPKPMYDAIADHKVTHLCGAPIVMSCCSTPPRRRGGASRIPSPSTTPRPRRPKPVLAAMAEAGFELTHLYGLTETYGPATVNEWHGEWDALAARGAASKRRAKACAMRRWKGLP